MTLFPQVIRRAQARDTAIVGELRKPPRAKPKAAKPAGRRKPRQEKTPPQPPRIVRLMWRHGGCCALCKRSVSLKLAVSDPLRATIDHIVPIARGGSNAWVNLQLACKGDDVDWKPSAAVGGG